METNDKTGLVALNSALSTDKVKRKFEEMLGKKAPGFITSITNVVRNNDLLQTADKNSIILAAATAAALDLPINPNLGYAAIIPFKDMKKGTCSATMQIMRNGWVELAQRSGQVVRICNEIVYEGELVSHNRFTDEYVFDESKRTSNKPIGYMAYVKLTNNFEKTVYWSVEECKAHGIKYSQTYKRGYGLWVDNFDAMALKTVLKHLITKYVPKSLEMQIAIERDQASFTGDIENPTPVYVDNSDFQDAEVVPADSKMNEKVTKLRQKATKKKDPDTMTEEEIEAEMEAVAEQQQTLNMD